MVSNDIMPFATAQGDRALLVGLNVEGLRRAGMDSTTIQALKVAYRTFFKSGLAMEKALVELEKDEVNEQVAHCIAFARASARGLARPRG